MERPILFSTEMVKAILAGSKTMTRRVIKPQPIYSTQGIPKQFHVGDILWVRETWQIGFTEGNPCSIEGWSKLQACVPCYRSGECSLEDNHPYKYLYKASPNTHEDYEDITWRPSIHMPRKACRLFLKVTNIRVERLQDITEKDARAEGISGNKLYGVWGASARISFAELWDSIYASRGDGWEGNPWVWVVEFERVEV